MNNAERSAAAEAAFRARLADLGAELLEPVWLGNSKPHRVRCGAGHEGRPRPADVQQGNGICRVCARNDPADAEARFRARLADLGAELLEPVWLGAMRPHRVRCALGHECAPTPAQVTSKQQRGVCRPCGYAGRIDPRAAPAEAAFRALLADLGAELLEPYRGTSVPHLVRCAAGHEGRPTPSNVLAGQGICRDCSGLSSAAGEAAFRARLAALGAELLGTYCGNKVWHRVRCDAGHECLVTPHWVNGGGGLCQTCGWAWDVFYVVADQAAGRIKFGITSGDPRPRLSKHRAAGYRERVLVLEGLPGTVALELERAARAALALAGVRPIKGREYYEAEAALAVVLDIADNYPRGGVSDTAPMQTPIRPRPGQIQL